MNIDRLFAAGFFLLALGCTDSSPPNAGITQTHITLDTTFGSSGVLRGYFSGATDSTASTVIKTIPLSDGKILVLASTDGTALGERISVSRWNSTGTALDTTFAAAEPTPGIIELDFGTHHTIATDMALQNDGKIIVSGATSTTVSTPDEAFILRLTAAGALDGAFATAGKFEEDFAHSYAVITALAINQTDNNVLFTGWVSNDQTTYKTLVGKLSSAGVPDNAFDGDGSRLIDYNAAPDFDADNAPGVNILLASSGKVIVISSGWDNGTLEQSAIYAQLTAAGADDTSFSVDGYLQLRNNAYIAPVSAALTTDDKIIAMVDTTNLSQSDSYNYVTRITAAGVIDTTFGTAGYAGQETTGSPMYFGGDVLVNSSGQIITTGLFHTGVAGFGTVYVQIFTASGATISTIDSGLKYSIDTNAGFDEFAYSASLDANGNLLVTGQEMPPGPTVRPGYVARFNLP